MRHLIVTGPTRWAARALPLILAMVFFVTPALADVYDDAWKRGNDAFFRGDFASALKAYEEIDRQGVVSADLFYNMGVAYFRSAQPGRAAWCLQRALVVRPDDEDALFNLTQVRKHLARQTTDKIEGAEKDAAWIRVVQSLPASTQTWIFVGLYLLTFVLLFLRRRRAPDDRAALTAGASLSAFAVLLCGSLLMGRAALDRIPFAVVLPQEVEVKEGGDGNYATLFKVHAGLRVRILEEEQNWVRVRLANGLEGWLKNKQVGRL